jgi:hypothetical protein
MTLLPIVLFLPAFWLADIGPCTFAHPAVLLLAAPLFVALNIGGLRIFVRNLRGSIHSLLGAGLALLGLFATVVLGCLGYAAEFN